MTFEQAKYFCTIADERSINKAAKLLNVSQPRLSHSMQAMEAELGFQIFYRSSMGSSLTPKGQELYQICRRMLQDYGLAKALSSGSRVTSSIYPGANMIAPMGCARSTDMKAMLLGGWAVSMVSILYIMIWSFAGPMIFG